MLRCSRSVAGRLNRSTLNPQSLRLTSTIPSERNWDPNAIYPTEKGHVRVTGITLRDGHQSLNGGLHRIDLLQKAATEIDKIRPKGMKFPGHEEIGGGTVVDFPLRFKGYALSHPPKNERCIIPHVHGAT